MLPGTDLVVSFVLDKARDRLRARFPAHAERLERAGWEMLDATVSALDDAYRRLDAGQGKAKRGARSSLDDHEVAAVVMRLFPEAVSATTAERRKMLAHALAGLLQPDLSPETRSRVSRAVAQLEASDVRELRKLAEAHPSTGGQRPASITPQLEPLLVAGCILSSPPEAGSGGQAIALTAVGRAVVAVLATWVG